MGNDHQIDSFRITQRRLPHWEDVGATYFLCLCLEARFVELTDPPIASMLIQALKYFDGTRYLLFDYTVMPDHVHMILKPAVASGRSESIKHIMRCLKGWTAKGINDAAKRTGEVWQEDTYDHIIRNQEDYVEKAKYIFENPKRAGLIENPADWPWWGRGSGEAGWRR